MMGAKERNFSWLSQNRRMSKNYERLCSTSESFVYAAMARLMVSGWPLMKLFGQFLSASR